MLRARLLQSHTSSQGCNGKDSPPGSGARPPSDLAGTPASLPHHIAGSRVSRSPVHPQRANKVSHKGASSKNDKQRVLAGWPHGREQTFLSCGPDSSHPTCYVAHSPFAAGNSWQQHVACKRRSEGNGFFKLLPRAFAITNSASTALFRPAKHSTYRALYIFSQCQLAAVNMR